MDKPIKTSRKLRSNLLLNFSVIILVSFIGSSSAMADEFTVINQQTPLPFEKAIRLAQKNDPWLTGNFHKQRSIELMSTAVNTLPDPKMSVGLANLPTNGFDFSQEGMTQAKIGISQMFPRGDTLAIKSQQLKIQSQAYPYQRKDRQSQVAVTVGTLWLDMFRVQQSIALIERNRSLFEQLVDVAEASYSSALGKTRQQDIVRAQLELTRLEDRLDQLAQQKSRYEGMLLQWLTNLSSVNGTAGNHTNLASFSVHEIKLTHTLPEISLRNHELVYSPTWHTPDELVSYLTKHPAVTAIEKKVSSTKTGIALAKQKYKPEWGFNASYGYRDDDPIGNNRADFFSVGLTFDVPMFTENRQDKEVQSAIASTEAVKTEKILLLRQLLGAFKSAKARLLRLKERQQLYVSTLLPQTQDQAEASLTAYTNDDGDFSEVVRSRISALNAEIDQLTLNVEEQKIALELNYLFAGNINLSNHQ